MVLSILRVDRQGVCCFYRVTAVHMDSSNFVVLLRCSFFFIHLLLRPLPIHPCIFKFTSLRVFWFFLDLVVPFIPSCFVSSFSWLAWRIFQCQILSQCSDPIFLLPVYGWLVGWWLVLDISTLVIFLMSNFFLYNNQFYFTQFSFTQLYSLIVKHIAISSDSV